MIELPEARTYARDLEKEILHNKIVEVGGNFTDHKFTFYNDPDSFAEKLEGKEVTAIHLRNFYVEIEIEDKILLFRDGANIRYFKEGEKLPAKSKLLLTFDDGSKLNMTTSMYAMVYVYGKNELIDNDYYLREIEGFSPIDKEFTLDYFCSLRTDKVEKLSTKAFLATEQRFLGIGNGVAQDIMFNAGLHPKRKIKTLSDAEYEKLYHAMQDTLNEMVAEGGRNTEKNLYGQTGGYLTIMSKTGSKFPCPKCGSDIVKENYLGGSIYFCPKCQPLVLEE